MHVTNSLSCIMFNMIVINNNNYMGTSDQSLWLFYKNPEIKAPAHIFMGEFYYNTADQSTTVEKHSYY